MRIPSDPSAKKKKKFFVGKGLGSEAGKEREKKGGREGALLSIRPPTTWKGKLEKMPIPTALKKKRGKKGGKKGGTRQYFLYVLSENRREKKKKTSALPLQVNGECRVGQKKSFDPNAHTTLGKKKEGGKEGGRGGTVVHCYTISGCRREKKSERPLERKGRRKKGGNKQISTGCVPFHRPERRLSFRTTKEKRKGGEEAPFFSFERSGLGGGQKERGRKGRTLPSRLDEPTGGGI